MRILVVHNKYKQPGGEDVVFHNESSLLSRNGHEVQQMIFDNSSIKAWYEKFLSGLLAVYNPASAHAIQRKIENFSPEIIHVHNYTPLVSPAVFFVANRKRIPIVFTLHNFRLLCPSATLFYDGSIYEKSLRSLFPWDAVWRGVYRGSRLQTAAVAFVTAYHSAIGTWCTRVNRYITPTFFAREKFINSRLSLPEEKLAVKPSFVENRGRGLTTRDDFFLFVGRLTPEKGIQTLLDGVEESGAKLVIIGDGPLRALVQHRVANNPRLCFLGFKDRDTIFEYLKSCRALLFPSIWYEGGTPLTILEAFSTGTLVLASKLGAMEEMIDGGVNGIHFEAGNAHDLAKKIAEANHYPERSKRIAEEGYQTYLDRYTPEKNYEQLIHIYHQAIAENRNKGKHEVSVPAAELEYTDN